MQLYEKYGEPFNYRTTQDVKYPTIEYGRHYDKFCLPSIDEHAFYDVFLIICSSATEFNRRSKIRLRMARLLKHFNVGYMFVSINKCIPNSMLSSISFDLGVWSSFFKIEFLSFTVEETLQCLCSQRSW